MSLPSEVVPSHSVRLTYHFATKQNTTCAVYITHTVNITCDANITYPFRANQSAVYPTWKAEKERKNMRKLKNPISICLCICMCLGMIFSVLIASGTTVSYAADTKRELWLIDDVNYALVKGTRTALSETEDLSPYQNDTGTMYIPVSIICTYMGASYTYDVESGAVNITLSNKSVVALTVGSVEWTLGGTEQEDFLIPVEVKNGTPFLSILMINGIFGTYNYYDSSMGLVIFDTRSVTGYSATTSSWSSQVTTISSIVMDRPAGTEVLADLENNAGSTTHPRLLVNQEKFDDMRETYNLAVKRDAYYNGISLQVRNGVNCFNKYFTVNERGEVEWKSEEMRQSVRQPHYLYDENGNRLIGVTEYTYTDATTGEEVTLKLADGLPGDGYDYGGRSNVNTFTSMMRNLAFAWQITEEDKYADAFYLYAIELDKWEHWGEGHFLNVADGSYSYAIGFDWIYHAFDNEPEKRDQMADILYRKGMMKGYYSIKYDTTNYKYSSWNSNNDNIDDVCDFSVSRAGKHAWRTIQRTNNWQTVCGAGMIVSALALAEYEDYQDECAYVIENYVKSVENCLAQFAPDGSYPESPTYWEYCVETYMNTLVAFEECCGESYGYKDVVGLYESYYYAIGITDSDYNIWSYHDTSPTTLGASYFYLAAKVYNDPNLAAYRNTMIFDRGWSMALMDILFYNPANDNAEFSAPLDYNFKGIYTATFRSSYDEDATYAGLHTGPTVHDHSDFDCGNFILSMDGIQWCGDPGSENYNVTGFWDTSNGGKRFKLYRKSLEGHSSIIIRSSELVHGQKWVQLSGSFPVINTFYTDNEGGYAISDMKGQYGSTCKSAYRGVLMTNSRRTVVLQDEITFSSATSLTWVLNLIGQVEIAKDGKSLTTFMWDGNEKKTMRVTLLTEDDSLTFRKLKSNETVLDSTYTTYKTGDTLACDTEPRIVIEANNVTEFNVAVVFEMIGHKDEVVGYEKVKMSDWTTCTDEWVNEANKDIIYPGQEPTYKYQASHFAGANRDLRNAGDDFAKVGEILARTLIYLTDYDKKNDTVLREVEQYMQYVTRYNYEVEKINNSFMDVYLGVVPANPVAAITSGA